MTMTAAMMAAGLPPPSESGVRVVARAPAPRGEHDDGLYASRVRRDEEVKCRREDEQNQPTHLALMRADELPVNASKRKL